jgi:AraC-like DNA-binding protein
MIEKIRSMLVNTTLSSKEIAQRLEFPNPSFFGRFVRQHLGCTPLEFRKRNK